MYALLLVYLISGVAEADGLCRTECHAHMAAYAPMTNEVYLGSLWWRCCSATVLVSAVFAAAIEPAAFKSNGDAIAAELTIMNFLLVKFEFVSVMNSPPFYVVLLDPAKVFRYGFTGKLSLDNSRQTAAAPAGIVAEKTRAAAHRTPGDGARLDIGPGIICGAVAACKHARYYIALCVKHLHGLTVDHNSTMGAFVPGLPPFCAHRKI